MRDGRVIEGTYLGGDARQVRMTVGEKIETFDLSVVAKIEFVSPLTGTAAPAPASAAGTLNGMTPGIAIAPRTAGETARARPSADHKSARRRASKTPVLKPAQPNQP